ncbi:hypothetical protein HPB50_015727 [Hyalomma asiaticum]|uniref:Uncharacterized protein n=1 Tax=Hyalomma asiaticum TaxID=266040 RepID=A0ACB7SWM0_HYAAI|nr:hypothetical protein HPB50_015727 [Hyalomma asiaticum]
MICYTRWHNVAEYRSTSALKITSDPLPISHATKVQDVLKEDEFTQCGQYCVTYNNCQYLAVATLRRLGVSMPVPMRTLRALLLKAASRTTFVACFSGASGMAWRFL